MISRFEIPIEVLRRRPGWEAALRKLHDLAAEKGDEAVARASELQTRYKGRRASAVVDAVASRQRRYIRRVKPMVEKFEQHAGGLTLGHLVDHGPGKGLGLRAGEADTMIAVAAGLIRFGSDHELAGDDTSCEAWARVSGPLAVAHELDPYVGAVNGIGPALFVYMQLLSGADALKPDLQTRKALNRLGFGVPAQPAALLVVAEAAATELSMPLAVLDQLLWWATQ